MKKLVSFVVYSFVLFAMVGGLLSVVEYLAMKENQRDGRAQPFMFKPSKGNVLSNLQETGQFQALDPLLGYAHSREEVQRLLDIEHVFTPGFVVYSSRLPEELARPFIVTLGGSTTDPVQYHHLADSWPHQLSIALRFKGYTDTVINGGVGGYSSSQELIKFIRDVVELKPDVVIAYHGINDVDVHWAKLPTPMIHSYSKDVFDGLIDSDEKHALFFMPNTTLQLWSRIHHSSETPQINSVIYGVETNKSAGEFLLRNVDMMRTLAKHFDIDFISVLQPVAPLSENVGNDWSVREFYADKIHATWVVARAGARERDYMYDFTQVLDGNEEVYLKDGIHLTSKGNRIIAIEIQKILYSRFHQQ